MRPGTHVPYTDADRQYWRSRGNRRVRKKRWARWTLRWTVLIGVHVLVVAALATVGTRVLRHVAGTEEFALTEIRIHGLGRITDEEIQRTVRPYLRRSLLDVDLDDVAANLERDPWIREASVRRVLPGTLDVRIRERSPVARLVLPDGARWVDANGVLLSPRGPEDDLLPRVDARRAHDPTAVAREALDALARIHAVDPAWYGEIRSIEPRGDTLAIDTRGGDRILLDRSRPERNLAAWLALRSEIGRRIGATEYVDLRWRGRVTVLPAAVAASTSHSNPSATGRPGR